MGSSLRLCTDPVVMTEPGSWSIDRGVRSCQLSLIINRNELSEVITLRTRLRRFLIRRGPSGIPDRRIRGRWSRRPRRSWRCQWGRRCRAASTPLTRPWTPSQSTACPSPTSLAAWTVARSAQSKETVQTTIEGRAIEIRYPSYLLCLQILPIDVLEEGVVHDFQGVLWAASEALLRVLDEQACQKFTSLLWHSARKPNLEMDKIIRVKIGFLPETELLLSAQSYTAHRNTNQKSVIILLTIIHNNSPLRLARRHKSSHVHRRGPLLI